MAQARTLTLTGATALVVANMIGTGIFVTSGFMARDLGSAWWVLGAWAAGGVLALCGAAVYAGLGAMMPRAGGEYVYLSRAFHPAVGFLSGWVSLIVGFSAPIAASATAFALYGRAVWPAVPVQLAAAGLIAALTAVHMADVVLGARVQTAFTALKVALLAGFAAGGLAFGDGHWSHLAVLDAQPGAGALAIALVFVAFSYTGWNAAAYVAGELRDPGRSLPRALLAGTAVVTLLYLALNLTFFYAAAPASLGADPEAVADVAARALFGEGLGNAVSTLIALALVSSVSAMVMAGPRVYMAMADDGLFFSAFARRNARGAPWVSVLVQGALAIILVFTAAFEELIAYIGFTLSAFSALTVLGAARLRRREPDAPRPYRALGWPVTPILFLVLATWIVAFSVYERPVATIAGSATLASGLVLYLFWARARRRPAAPFSS